MIKGYNKQLDIVFYVDEWNEHTDEKIRIYDSNKDYCDYLEESSVLESCEHLEQTPEQYIKDLVSILENANDIKDFCNEFLYDYMIEENNGQERDDMTNVFGKWLVILV